MRVWAISDLHTDYKQNLEWCEALSRTRYLEDALIVAGDVSDDLEVLRATLRLLAARWARVFFTPGNHDLWTRRAERERYDSLGKLSAVRAVCTEEGVSMDPARLDGLWIVPLLAWYHASWDREPDVPGALPAHKMMVDYHACRWPEGLTPDSTSLAEHFDAMNVQPLAPLLADIGSTTSSGASTASDPSAAAGGNGAGGSQRPTIITFSHFLPFQELLPEKRLLRHPNLAKAVGSDPLAARLAALQPDVHVFGHTHFSWDASLPLSGRPCRFVQQPLAYPAERADRAGGWAPLLVWDGGGQTPPTQPYWARHYAEMERDPQNVRPAPWCCVR